MRGGTEPFDSHNRTANFDAAVELMTLFCGPACPKVRGTYGDVFDAALPEGLQVVRYAEISFFDWGEGTLGLHHSGLPDRLLSTHADARLDWQGSFLTRVPEPGTIVLLSLGLIGLGLVRRHHAINGVRLNRSGSITP